MLVTCEEMRNAEQAAFARGIKAADLMGEAGRGIAGIVRNYFPHPGTCLVACGKGNNAGDGLVAARHLKTWGWEIFVLAACGEEQFSERTARHFQALSAPAYQPGNLPGRRPLVILDGLLGIGAHGAPRDPIAKAVNTINTLRREAGGWVLAIDLPSGLDGDSGIPAEPSVLADLTATIGATKLGLVADPAGNMVGSLVVVLLPDLEFSGPEEISVSTPASLRSWLPPRLRNVHKGDCGRVGIIAGSPGYMGAARLCAEAAVRAGAGLVTLYATPEIASSLAISSVPEVMVRTVNRFREVEDEVLDVLAVGPGCGRSSEEDILSLIKNWPQPMLIDADALNILSTDIGMLTRCRGPRLLTPHPGEMERLFPAAGRSRRQWMEGFLRKYPVTLLLKGSRTLIGEGERLAFNSTGNPGMASGGMGDVLTGVCAALIPQLKNKDLFVAGVLGAWLCGRAAEKAVFSPGGSPESLVASDIIGHLGAAFRALREDC